MTIIYTILAVVAIVIAFYIGKDVGREIGYAEAEDIAISEAEREESYAVQQANRIRLAKKAIGIVDSVMNVPPTMREAIYNRMCKYLD